jgi:ATP-dependent DNA helicase RecQ
MLVVRKTLSGVARAAGRCGRQRVIQMLCGSRSQGVTELGLDKLSTYGLLRDLDRADVRDLFEQLEAEEYIRTTGDRFPIVIITARGVRAMKGEEKVELAFPVGIAAEPSAAPGRSPRGARSEDEGGGDFDEALFEKLRKLRRRLAEELKVPAYRVFGDRTLRAMAREVPGSEREMLTISGVGAITFEKFGRDFLGIIRAHAGKS